MSLYSPPPILGAFISTSTLGNPIFCPWISNPVSNFGLWISRFGPLILGPFISIPPPILRAFISTSTLGNPILLQEYLGNRILGPWISKQTSNLGR